MSDQEGRVRREHRAMLLAIGLIAAGLFVLGLIMIALMLLVFATR